MTKKKSNKSMSFPFLCKWNANQEQLDLFSLCTRFHGRLLSHVFFKNKTGSETRRCDAEEEHVGGHRRLVGEARTKHEGINIEYKHRRVLNVK